MVCCCTLFNKKIGLHSVHVWLAIRIKLNYLKKMRHEHFEVKISPYYKWLVIEFQITLNLAYMLVILEKSNIEL